MPQAGGPINRPPKPKKPPKPKPVSSPGAAQREAAEARDTYTTKADAKAKAAQDKDAGGKPGGPSQRLLEAKKGGNTAQAQKSLDKTASPDKKSILLKADTVSPKTGKKLSGSATISTRQGEKADRDLTRPSGGGGGRKSGGGRAVRTGGGATSTTTRTDARGGSTFADRDQDGTFHLGRPDDSVGGGFAEFGSGYRPPPAYFDTGGAGGGQSGGGANPLASSVAGAFSQVSLDEVLHGNKKKGRAKRSRRTE